MLQAGEGLVIRWEVVNAILQYSMCSNKLRRAFDKIGCQIGSISWYNLTTMPEKPLSETNPYLQDPKERDRLIVISASTSSEIEGIHVPLKVIAKALRPGWKPNGRGPSKSGQSRH